VAWVESRLKNVANQTTDAMGPFQFLPSTWADLVARHGQQEDITERDIVNVGKQAVCAAIHTAEAQEQLVGKLGRLPTGAELYVAHHLGLPAALVVLSAERAMPIDRALMPVLQGQADAAGAVRHIVDQNQALLKAGDQVKTVEGVLAAARGGRQPDDAAWCAAFVSFCMQHSGNALVVAQNQRSARAADWLHWGQPITEPTWGAVCVLEPLVPRSSGHVGFLTGSDAPHVTLLGGNQRDTNGNESVNGQRFSKLKVRGYRWLDLSRTNARREGTASAVAQGTRVKQAFDHLSRTFTPAQAAGLVGNFMQESGESLDPTAFNAHEGTIGIAQWRRERRARLQAFAAQRGTTETDFHVQLEFVMHELNGREAHAKAQIQACTTPEQAAIAVRAHYERAQPDHDSHRIAFAREVADRFQIT
jgi:uncharacterized protein (TIGR02594 family)